MIDPQAPDFLSVARAEVERRMTVVPAGSTLWFRLFDAFKSLEAAVSAEQKAAAQAEETAA